MRSPRVSVICIFYNAERFLREALNSVMGQDFRDFELLLVDDGSSDAGTAAAKAFAAEFPAKVRYLEHERHENRGMSASRNLGIRSAQGEFIAFIDADDVWNSHKLSEQVSLLNARPEVGMVCGKVNYWRSWQGGKDRLVPTGDIRDGASLPPRTAVAVYPLGLADAPCPSDIMLRRSVANQVGGFEDQFRGFYEDIAFFVKVFVTTPVWFSTRTWVNYRLHAGSSSSAVSRERYDEVRREFLNWFAAYLEQHAITDKMLLEGAILRALWELDHPVVGRLVRRFRRLVSGVLRLPALHSKSRRKVLISP